MSDVVCGVLVQNGLDSCVWGHPRRQQHPGWSAHWLQTLLRVMEQALPDFTFLHFEKKDDFMRLAKVNLKWRANLAADPVPSFGSSAELAME